MFTVQSSHKSLQRVSMRNGLLDIGLGALGVCLGGLASGPALKTSSKYNSSSRLIELDIDGDEYDRWTCYSFAHLIWLDEKQAPRSVRAAKRAGSSQRGQCLRATKLMKNGKSEPETGKMTAVKVEVDDSLEEEHGPFHKRPKPYFWQYKSRYEGDLVAKCYFAKHKLVWEVLDGGLKNKIEIQWSDIMALKANCPDDGPGTLDVVLARQPLFFRETNPQPRKHTLWQATSDFTGGQASLQRRHYLECPQGLLGKHFEKLTQCDPRLNFLSQKGEIMLDSPHFEPRISLFDDPSENNAFDLSREDSPSFFTSQDAASPSVVQSSSSNFEQDAPGRHPESYRLETPSPSSGNIIMFGFAFSNGHHSSSPFVCTNNTVL
ncbi:uncharacterized protein LOC111372434 [Olea europaea var. sylvestris]|uniref:uncharacterized protein LOC111372434 n=1 Tax=Olea europaea var. sylvestris TaxID=158386 RepID=UPI000C1D65AE|nr:uncharacterized protein LOC111372434 [Olea europaea var. sylvestris]